jgi:hypothetical protein
VSLASVVDTWRAVNIWTKNVREVQNEFLLLIQVPLLKQMKTQVLNLKMSKTQVPIRYLTQNFMNYPSICLSLFLITL